MKKLLMMAAMMAMTLSVNAQHEEGDVTIQPRVGVTFSTITDESDAKMKVNLTYGFEVERFFTDKFSLGVGVMFTNQGFKSNNYGDDKVKSKVVFDNYYATIPITVNYFLVKGLAVKAGIQPAFRVKTKVKIDDTKMDMDKALDFLYSKDVKLNKFDLAIPVGLSYEINGITLDARYHFGLIKLFKGLDDDSSRNRVISLTLGYKF